MYDAVNERCTSCDRRHAGPCPSEVEPNGASLKEDARREREMAEDFRRIRDGAPDEEQKTRAVLLVDLYEKRAAATEWCAEQFAKIAARREAERRHLIDQIDGHRLRMAGGAE